MAWSLSLRSGICSRSWMKRFTASNLATSPGSKPSESCRINLSLFGWRNSTLISALPGPSWETCWKVDQHRYEILQNNASTHRFFDTKDFVDQRGLSTSRLWQVGYYAVEKWIIFDTFPTTNIRNLQEVDGHCQRWRNRGVSGAHWEHSAVTSSTVERRGGSWTGALLPGSIAEEPSGSEYRSLNNELVTMEKRRCKLILPVQSFRETCLPHWQSPKYRSIMFPIASMLSCHERRLSIDFTDFDYRPMPRHIRWHGSLSQKLSIDLPRCIDVLRLEMALMVPNLVCTMQVLSAMVARPTLHTH